MAEKTAKKTNDDLAELLRQCPAVGTKWRHYKTGNLYFVVCCSIREATQEPEVVYQPFNSVLKFNRPLKEWAEIVEWDEQWGPRFTQVI